jgi:hypothetical protein
MVDERRQHLEVIASHLTHSYYTVHTAGGPDHKEIIDTYLFFLEALETHDRQKPGESPLTSSDTLAPYEADNQES